MKAGFDLDVLVAERVMGFKESSVKGIGRTWNRKNDDDDFYLKRYSTDIAAAWEVFEKVKDKGLELGWNKEHEKWFCTNLSEDFRYGLSLSDKEFKESFNETSIAVLADSAPIAICLAALKAVGVDSL